MDTINFMLPFPPSINDYYGRAKNGQKYIKARGVKFRNDVKLYILKNFPNFKTLDIRLSSSLLLFPPDRRDRDHDNYHKPVWDALQHAGIYANDKLIRSCYVEIFDYEKQRTPGAFVTLFPYKKSLRENT